MEFCDGGDLSSFIKTRQHLNERVCQSFLQQLASALEFLRANSVSHMDLKPQNLLLTSKSNPQLKLTGNNYRDYYKFWLTIDSFLLDRFWVGSTIRKPTTRNISSRVSSVHGSRNSFATVLRCICRLVVNWRNTL